MTTPTLRMRKLLAARDWQALRMLIPFFAEYKGRVAFAFGCLLIIQGAQLATPFLLKFIVDDLDPANVQVVSVPIALLAAYVIVRFSSVGIAELRDAIFGTVTVRAMRRLSVEVLRHLHALDLDYHLARKTGAVSRDMDRGVNAITSLIRTITFQLLSMFIGVFGVVAILLANYDWHYALIVLAAVALYCSYTVRVTAWRTLFIRESNDATSRANTRAIDSLINYETVKYFGNESLEASLYDRDLEIWERARSKNRYSLAALNTGQSFLVHAGMFGMMFLAARGVVDGRLSLGDFVAINAFAVQVFVPLANFGFIYRQLKSAFTDVERMLDILETRPRIVDRVDSPPLPPGHGSIVISNVSFGYQRERQILRNVSFEVGHGEKVALVGPSGSGKSTLARLLFRFYDPDTGTIEVNGADIRSCRLDSLRRAFGVVPQDSTLFNDTLYNNLSYGRSDATREDIERAVRLTHLDELVHRSPQGYDTVVGERGLRLSGGEKQRVAIARAILKDPPFLIFDEATSSLDSVTERSIMSAIEEVAAGHTTLIIAHRLSTIVDADRIVVLTDGEVRESGTHHQLLARGDIYSQMWAMQQKRATALDQPDAVGGA